MSATAKHNNTQITCACIYMCIICNNNKKENYFLWLKFLFAATAQKTFLNNSFFCSYTTQARANQTRTNINKKRLFFRCCCFFSRKDGWFPYTLRLFIYFMKTDLFLCFLFFLVAFFSWIKKKYFCVSVMDASIKYFWYFFFESTNWSSKNLFNSLH